MLVMSVMYLALGLGFDLLLWTLQEKWEQVVNKCFTINCTTFKYFDFKKSFSFLIKAI